VRVYIVRVSRVRMCVYYVSICARERAARGHLMSSGWLRMAEGAGFSGRYANKPLPDVSGVRFGLKLLLASVRIIVVGRIVADGTSSRRRRHVTHGERKRFGLLLTALSCTTSRDQLARRRILEIYFRERAKLADLLDDARGLIISRSCSARAHEARARVI